MALFGRKGLEVLKKFHKDIDDPKYWNTNYLRSKSKRSPQQAAWLRYANAIDDDMWRGVLLPDGTGAQDINELKSSLLAILPQVILEEPEIDVRSYTFEDAPEAMIWEKVGQNIEYQNQLFKALMMAVYDALLYGDGVFKIGMERATMLKNREPLVPLSESFGNVRQVYSSPTSLYEIFPDYRARTWEQQRYLIHRVAMHMDDVIDNPAYDRKVTRGLTPVMTEDVVYGYKNFDHEDGSPEHIPLIEVHDFIEGKLRIFAAEQGGEQNAPSKFLYNGPLPYPIPVWENLQFFMRPLSIWGDSISQLVYKHQRALGETMTYMNRALSREGILKMLYDVVALDDTQISKLESGGDALVGVTLPTSRALSDITHVINYATSTKDFNFQQGMNYIREIIREGSGVTSQERGVHEAGVETKFEASMLKAGSDVRNALRRRMFSIFASRVMRKLFYIISVEYSPERIARMAGLDPFIYSPVIAKMLPFDASKFKVDYGSTAVNSRNERVQKLQLFQQLLAPYAQMINPAIWLKLVTKELGFEYDTEMLIYNAMGMSGQQNNQLGSSSSVTNAGNQLVQSSRVVS